MSKILTITSILIVIAFGVGIYLAYATATQFIALKKQEIENKARFECAQSSKYEVTDDNTTVSYPITNLYKACLKEKGI